MANDLKPIARQFSEQPVSLGQNNAFNRMQQSLTQLADFASGKAVELYEQDAIAKGKQLALSKQGIPQDLAPSANRTTSAFNNAYNEMTAGILSTKLEGLLSNNLALKSNKATLGPNSIAELNALNNSTWIGFESQIPKNMRADMEYAYMNGNEKTLSALSGTLSKFNQENLTADMKIVGDRAKEDYAATILTGNKEQQSQALAGVTKWLNNAKILGGMTDVQFQDQVRQVQDIALDSHVHRDMMDAVQEGGEEGMASYIVKTLNSTPEQLGVTPAQKQVMAESALKYKTLLTNQMNVASMQGYNNILLDSISNPGSITSIPQLNQKIAEQEQKGFQINQTQQISLQSKIFGKNKEAAKRAVSNAKINESVMNGDIDIVNVSGSDLNNYWEDLTNAAQEKVKSMEADGTVAPGQIKGWQMEAQAAVNIQREVPALTARIEARLTGPNSNNTQDGLKQYLFLKKNNPLALEGLSDKTEAFAITVLEKIRNVADPLIIEKTIADTKVGVLDALPEVVEQRQKDYAAWAKKNPNAVNKEIRNAIGIKNGFWSKDAIPDTQRARYNRILSTNIDRFETKDRDLAFKTTNEEFKNIYKEDPGFAPKGMLVSNSISNLPWSKTTGSANQNQVAQAISKIVDINSKFPGKTGFTIEHSNKMPKFPSKMSDTDKVEKNFAPQGNWMKIGGIDRKMYLVSPNYAGTNPYGTNSYQFLWGDTGKDGKSTEVLRPFVAMNTITHPNGRQETIMGPSLITILPPNVYIPALHKKQQSTAASVGFDMAAFNVVNEADPIKITDFYSGATEDSAMENALKKIQTKNKKIKTELPSKSKEIEAQFETERLVREALEKVQNDKKGGQ